jgi:hypothetical protein
MSEKVCLGSIKPSGRRSCETRSVLKCNTWVCDGHQSETFEVNINGVTIRPIYMKE